MAKFSDYHGVLSVKDPAFGAVGDGVTNDTTAIQNCFNAAFGSPASPHGLSGRFSNRAVFFPPGNYITSAPLYLVGVHGGRIFGNSPEHTRISYNNVSFPGNSQNTDTGSNITPVIMTNGFSHSSVEGIALAISNNVSTCFYLFWDGIQPAGPTANTFKNMSFEGGAEGFLIGYQSAGLCSETLVLNCSATLSGNGFRNISQNALDNQFIGCNAHDCTVSGFSVPTGGVNIYGAGFAGNPVDIIAGQDPMFVVGCRTESASFFDGNAAAGRNYISGCVQAESAHTAGYFARLNSSCSVIIEACVQADTGSTSGVISGSGGKVYLRGNEFRNTSYLSGFTGTVAELDIPVGLVSALPTAATKYKGLHAVVTDANSTTFLATAAGSGGNTVPVFCDGTNWKIG